MKKVEKDTSYYEQKRRLFELKKENRYLSGLYSDTSGCGNEAG